MAARKNFKLSRARWKGSWYFRKRDGYWRNPNTGEIRTSPGGGNRIGWEETGAHRFNPDVSKIKRKTKPKVPRFYKARKGFRK